MIPFDVLLHILEFMRYRNLIPWNAVSTQMYGAVGARLKTVTYPQDLDTLRRLHPNTEEIHLRATYKGLVSFVRVHGHGHTIEGIVKRCVLTNCALRNAVLIHTELKESTICDGEHAHNVEMNGECTMESVQVCNNVKGFINMGFLRMTECMVINNITGFESRGSVYMENCDIRDNSVGVHCCGDMEQWLVQMRNNTINLLRTQPARPVARCWTQ